MSKKSIQTSVAELDREKAEVYFRSGLFARRKGQRQPAEVVKAKSRVRTASWRVENDRAARPEAVDVANALLRAMVSRHDPESIDPADRSIIGAALTELIQTGYDLNQIKAVCRRLRKRVLAESRTPGEF
jgi:hypothetical protein